MNKFNPTLIGAFVIGALLLAAAAVFVLGGKDLLQQKRRAVIYFSDSVTGLSVGAPVTFRGVRVGEVTDVRVDFDAATLGARIPVQVLLHTNKVRMLGAGPHNVADVPFEKFIEKGLRAKLAMQSFVTGQLDVELDFLPNTPANFVGPDPEENNEIPAVRSEFGVLREELAQLPLKETLDELRLTMTSVRQTTDKIGGEVATTGASARKTADALTRAVNTLQQDTSRTLLAVQKVSDHLDGDLTQLTPMLRDTLLTAQRAIKDADVTLAHTAEFTAPGAPARSDLEEALRKLAIASEALRNFAETIERNPQALIRGGARQ